MTINFCNLHVGYSVPTLKQCFKCSRYKDVSKLCKAKESRCLNCSKSPKHTKNCEMLRCLSRGSSERNTLNKFCPNIERQLTINKIVMVRNLSYREVKENFSLIYFECLEDNSYDENFPPLGNSSTTLAKDDNGNVNTILTKKIESGC